jgi:hypothetical protein
MFAPVRQKSGNRTLNDRFGPFLGTKHLSPHDKSNIRGNPAKSTFERASGIQNNQQLLNF